MYKQKHVGKFSQNHPCTGQETFLKPFLSLMESIHGNYCVLHSYSSLPFYIESDLDIAIHDINLTKFENLLNSVALQTNWEIVQRLWYDVPTCFYYVLRSKSRFNTWIAIDILLDSKGIGRYGFSSSVLTNHAIKFGSFYHANPSIEFCYKLTKRIRKGSFKQEDLISINLLFHKGDKNFIKSVLEGHYSRWGARTIIQTFENNGGFVDKLPHLWLLSTIQLILCRYGYPSRLIMRIKWQILRIYYRLTKPTGLILWVPRLSRTELKALNDALVAQVGPAFRKINTTIKLCLFQQIISLATSTLLIRQTKDENIRVRIQHFYFNKGLIKDVDFGQSRSEIVSSIASVASEAIFSILRDRIRKRTLSSKNL